MTDARIRWGVLGTARIGAKLVNPAIRHARNGTLSAIASRDVARAREAALAQGAERWYGSYEALLDDPDIDAVYLPLPNALHHPWTLAALARGKHVLCEKPLALSAAQCREMGDASHRHDRLLMEAFMYRFHPRTELMAAMVREDGSRDAASGAAPDGRVGARALGALRTIRSGFTFKLSRPNDIRLSAELGGGALMDVGCYCVSVSRLLAGAEPVEVQAVATFGASGVDTELHGVLRFADGVVASFDCALTLERREFVEAVGTDGALHMDPAFLPGTADALLHERRGGDARTHVVPGVDQYQRMVEHFGDAVVAHRAGVRGPLRNDAHEAACTLAVIEALLASARNGGRPQAVRA